MTVTAVSQYKCFGGTQSIYRHESLETRCAMRFGVYRPPQATIDAFWFVVVLDDLDRLAAWLDDHPRDKPTLLKLLESK